MKLITYTIWDEIAKEASLVLTAPSDALLIRQIKSGMMAKEFNFLNTNIPDKTVWSIAVLDTETKEITAHTPEMIIRLDDIYDELIAEIKHRKEQLKGIQEVEVPTEKEIAENA